MIPSLGFLETLLRHDSFDPRPGFIFFWPAKRMVSGQEYSGIKVYYSVGLQSAMARAVADLA
jgi:hypothetical protein